VRFDGRPRRANGRGAAATMRAAFAGAKAENGSIGCRCDPSIPS
jgi:hypothetical protein